MNRIVLAGKIAFAVFSCSVASFAAAEPCRDVRFKPLDAGTMLYGPLIFQLPTTGGGFML